MKETLKIGVIAVLAVSCGKASKSSSSSDQKTSSTTTDTTSSARVGTLALSDLNLSDSINPPIPSTVLSDTSGSSLSLTTGSKSMERCLLQQAVSEVKTNVSMVASQLCMLGKTPGLNWGGKYNIKFPGASLDGPPLGGPDSSGPSGSGAPPPGGAPSPGSTTASAPAGMPTSMQVFMDDSVAGKHSIYICADNKLTQVIHIDDAKKGVGAQGSFAINMDMGSMGGVQLAGTFDNGIGTAGRYLGETRMRFTAGTMKASSDVKMDLGLASTDVSFVQSSRETAASFSDTSNSTRELIAGRIGPSYGMSVVQSNDSQFDSATASAPKTAVSYFTADGTTATVDASTDFASGGSLYVSNSDFIKLLPTDYSVALDGWDCSGTTDLDMSALDPSASSDMTSCNSGTMTSASTFSCFDAAQFAPGAPVPDAPILTGDGDRTSGSSFSSEGAPIPPPPDAPSDTTTAPAPTVAP